MATNSRNQFTPEDQLSLFVETTNIELTDNSREESVNDRARNG